MEKQGMFDMNPNSPFMAMEQLESLGKIQEVSAENTPAGQTPAAI